MEACPSRVSKPKRAEVPQIPEISLGDQFSAFQSSPDLSNRWGWDVCHLFGERQNYHSILLPLHQVLINKHRQTLHTICLQKRFAAVSPFPFPFTFGRGRQLPMVKESLVWLSSLLSPWPLFFASDMKGVPGASISTSTPLKLVLSMARRPGGWFQLATCEEFLKDISFLFQKFLIFGACFPFTKIRTNLRQNLWTISQNSGGAWKAS